MKKHRKSNFFKRPCRAPDSAWCLRQAPQGNPAFGRTAARQEPSIGNEAITAVWPPHIFLSDDSPFKPRALVETMRGCAPYSKKTKRQLRLERAQRLAMRMTACRPVDHVGSPPSGTTASPAGFPDALDIERAMRLHEAPSAAQVDRKVVSWWPHGLERRARLSDAEYNARLMRNSEHGQNMLAIFVLARAVVRLCEPCTIRSLLERAGLGDAGFMGAVWMIAAGRLLVLSPGRLSLLTFVKPAGPCRAPRVPAPGSLAPGQCGAQA